MLNQPQPLTCQKLPYRAVSLPERISSSRKDPGLFDQCQDGRIFGSTPDQKKGIKKHPPKKETCNGGCENSL
jgi:hypothetical protein